MRFLNRSNPAVAFLLVVILGFETGCSERSLLQKEDLTRSERYREFYVTTRDGRERTYIYLASGPDSLTGTVQERADLLVESGSGKGSRQSVTRIRKERVAWADVTRIEAPRAGRTKLLLAGLGAIALGVGAVLLLSGGGEADTDGGGGKPPIGEP